MSLDKSPETPPPRDLYQESAQTLQAQVDLAPDLYAAEAEYRPKYNALTMSEMEKLLFGTQDEQGQAQRGLLEMLGQANPRFNQLEADALSAKRSAEIADLQKLGAQAVDAYDAIDPETAKLKDTLTSQAQQELDRGGELDPSVLRQVTQGVRGQQALQGFGYDPQSFAREVGAVGREAEGRKMQRRAFAQSVAAQNASTGLDPTMLLFNKPSTLGATNSLMNQGAGYANMGGPQLFTLNSPYAADLFNTNYNAEAAARMQTSNNEMAMNKAAASLLGTVAMGAFMCWVAREVYGPANPEWISFRAWMRDRAPSWLRNLYMAHGETWASWIRKHPVVKPALRRIMDFLKG